MYAIAQFFVDPIIKGHATAASFSRSLSLLPDVFRSFGPTAQLKGNVVERAVMQRLVALGQSDRLTTVPDLPFFPSDQRESSPWRTVPFAATCMQSCVQYPDVPAFVASPDAIGTLFLPDPICRPDGILMLKDANGSRRAITLGVAVYSGKVTSDKVANQFSSSDMSRAYLSTRGLSYNAAKANREAWCREGLDKTVALRVHVSLPTSKTEPPTSQLFYRETKVEGSGAPVWFVSKKSMTAADMVIAAGKNDFIVDLDKSNVHLLLGKPADTPETGALYELLKIATGDGEGWPA